MKTPHLAVGFIVALMAAGAIEAQPAKVRWKSLGRFGSDMRLNIDLTRVATVGDGVIEVWTRSLSDRGQTLESRPGAKYVSTLQRYQLRCPARRVFTAESIFYDADGDVVHSSPAREPNEQDWNGVVPETVGEAILDAGCASHYAEERRRKTVADKEQARADVAAALRIRREGNSDARFALAEASKARNVFCPRDPYRSPDICSEGVRIFFQDTVDARKYGFRRDTSLVCRTAVTRLARDSTSAAR